MTRLFTDDDRGILLRAVDTWGTDAQECLAVEELAEAIVALARTRRGRDDPDVVDEIADILIMANQLAVIYGEPSVEARLEHKLSRLDTRLDIDELRDTPKTTPDPTDEEADE